MISSKNLTNTTRTLNRKNFVFYLVTLILLGVSFFCFNRSYRELIRYKELKNREGIVHSCFQSISRQIINAAVTNPDLLGATGALRTNKLFFIDSQFVFQQLALLKSTVRDSINIRIASELSPIIRSELAWIIKSNVPDSILHHRAAPHITILEKIDSLVNAGIKRTDFLLSYRDKQLNAAISRMRVWMGVFILSCVILLFYTLFNLLRQRYENERRFRTLIENSDDIIAMLDEDLFPVYRSPSAERITGYTAKNRDDAVKIWDIYPDDRLKIDECLAATKANPGKAIPVTYRLKHKQGHYIWLEGTFTNLIHDPAVKAIVANMRDITKRMKEEERLKLLESVITNTNDAVLITEAEPIDEPGPRIVYVNGAFTKMTGYTAEEVIGKTPRILQGPKSDRQELKRLREALRCWQPCEISIINYKKNGEEFWINFAVNPVTDSKGWVTYWVSVERDITLRKNAEIALQESTKSLEDYMFALNESSIIAVTDSKGIILTVNDNFCKISRYSREELIGNTHRIINSNHHPREFFIDLWRTISSGKTWRGEIMNKTKDGDYYWVYTTITPFLDHNNKPFQYLAIRFDITEKKMAEQALFHSLNDKKIILESIGDGFFAVDKNWIVTYWNNQAEKILSKRKDEVEGYNLWEVFSTSPDSKSYKKYHYAVETNQVIHFEDYYTPLNKWYEVSAYPSGNGLSVYFKDVTERKVSEIRLNKLNEDLQKQTRELAVSNAELEQFAYVASHDLQEPLRMVTSFLTQLEKKYAGVLDDKGQKYIDFAVDGAKRMRHIILDLLEFSRVGRAADAPESIDLNELVNDIQILFRKQAEEKKAVIKTGRLPVINSYKAPLRQVFQNLVSNALKYSKKNIPPQVEITAKETDSGWEFAVADNGIGISSVYFDKIFIIFQRLHNKDEFSGTGMGLAVSKKIIENWGGRIWVKSEEGVGSTFYFTINK